MRATQTFLRIAAVPVLTILVAVQAGAATPAEESLYREVVDRYRGARRAVTSVQCSYTHTLNESDVRHCRYARQGESFYHAHLARSRNGGLGFPTEVAWDGHVAYARQVVYKDPPHFRQLSRATDRERAKPGCPLPENEFPYVDTACGITAVGGQAYTFRAAREIQFRDHDCVELTFDAPFIRGGGGTLVTRHARDLGCYPLSIEMTRRDGSVSLRTTDIGIRRYDVGGRALFYPAHVAYEVEPAREPHNVVRFAVDPDSVRLNENIPESCFTLIPYPSEGILDWDTLKTSPAADPNWAPGGRVGFPFAEFLAAMSKAH